MFYSRCVRKCVVNVIRESVAEAETEHAEELAEQQVAVDMTVSTGECKTWSRRLSL